MLGRPGCHMALPGREVRVRATRRESKPIETGHHERPAANQRSACGERRARALPQAMGHAREARFRGSVRDSLLLPAAPPGHHQARPVAGEPDAACAPQRAPPALSGLSALLHCPCSASPRVRAASAPNAAPVDCGGLPPPSGSGSLLPRHKAQASLRTPTVFADLRTLRRSQFLAGEAGNKA